VAGADEADAGAVGEESAALGRGRTRRTAWGGRSVDGGSLLKGVAGDNREGGGSGSGDATRRRGDVGPGSDRRAARLCFGSGASTRLARGP
jgi:hypothetical protein